ncbi:MULTISPECIES: glycosyltransferase family 2 protein [Isoptericola]|uniref:glycosyltransferase family 2 protein n=1 Tax=Isoptericola TaxID=254250 RepID=UPI00383A16E0
MRSTTPAVTVGMPVYNASRYLEQSLAALRDQELENIEVVVADNGSTDGTRDIAAAFAAADDRFRLVTGERNIGMPRNYNRVLGAARSDLFMWNASDDRVRPGHLRACVEALGRHPRADVAFSKVVYIDADSQVSGRMDDDELDFLTPGPAERARTFLTRDVYQAIGYGAVMRTGFIRGIGGMPVYFSSDVALGIRMALRSRWVQVDEQLYEARRHEAQSNKLRTADIADQSRIIDPDHPRRYGLPEWYLTYRMAVEALGAPVPVPERFRALGAVASGWTIPNWRLLPFDVKRNLVRLTKGRYVGTHEVHV